MSDTRSAVVVPVTVCVEWAGGDIEFNVWVHTSCLTERDA
jgi:hypothetical protein